MQRFGHALEAFGSSPSGCHDLAHLGGRIGLGIAMGAGLALVGLLLWLFV